MERPKMTQTPEDRLADLLSESNAILTYFFYKADVDADRDHVVRLWFRTLHGFSADAMDDLETSCDPPLMRCRDGSCMESCAAETT